MKISCKSRHQSRPRRAARLYKIRRWLLLNLSLLLVVVMFSVAAMTSAASLRPGGLDRTYLRGNDGRLAKLPASTAQPIRSFLNADGSIKKGAAGSFDPKGFRMANSPGGAPRFVRNGDSSTNAPATVANGFAGVGPEGTAVFAVAVSGSDVYVGGSFTTAGDISAPYIAKWNGTNWSTLGSGMNGFVHALAVAGNGEVYAGGSFTMAGDVPVRFIAKWNGSAWSALGSGLIGGVGDIEVLGNDIYASGSFVAKWNGSAWSYIAPGGSGAVIKALAVSGSDLYAIGVFTAIAGVPANNIAKWNGSSWSALGSGISGNVNAVAVSGSTVYAGGYFTTAGGVSANNIAMWNGSNWSPLSSGIVGAVNAIAIAGSGKVYVGGDIDSASGIWANNIAEWNGSSWSSLGSGVSSQTGGSWVLAVAISSNGNVYAGGYFSTAGGFQANNIAVWNGTDWSALVHFDPPSQQAVNITFANVRPYKMDVSWTNGNGSGRVVKINTVSSFTAPVDGTTPGGNSRYGGEGEQVLYNGTDSSFTVTGLAPNTTYYFGVYEYNGYGTYTVFNTNTAANNPNSQATISCNAASTVQNTNDDGVGSLRRAISEICSGGAIDFDPSVFATPQTITLTSGELIIDAGVAIHGPGMSQLSISGNNLYRVFYINEGVTTTLDGMTIRDGHAGDGSSGYWGDGSGITNAGTLTVSNSAIVGNNAEVYAGGIRNFAVMTVINSTVSGNNAYYGDGGIGNNATMTVTDSVISGNSSDGAGGIWNGGYLTIANSTVSGNAASGVAGDYYYLAGGGIFNEGGSVVFSNSTIFGNTAGYGGAIFNYYFGSVTANSSTISGNTASYGGAISNYFSSVTANNSMISGNTATSGGGIFNYSFVYCDYECYSGNASESITNGTVAGNPGGGIYSYNDGQVDSVETLKNTIIAGNSGDGGDILGTIETASHNLIGDAGSSGGIQNGVNGNIVGVNPLLGPLANNGGPTKTHALLAGSPAINAGDNCVLTENGCGDGNPALTTDQRGMPRNGAVDIGAFERQTNDVSGKTTPFDFDGDGKADVSVWRQSTGEWWVSRSSDGGYSGQVWGVSSDVMVPADYDGDGKTDVAAWRPSTGEWWVLRSSDGTYTGRVWGVDTDVPVPGDYDGDGKADIAVWRPSTGEWWILRSSDGTYTGQIWGVATDKPVNGDFDGDGKTDIAVWRPSTGEWWAIRSSNGSYLNQVWGIETDKPVVGDFDGDRKTDIAVWRPSTGEWWILRSSNGSYTGQVWGVATDIPIPADYDGDGKTDIAAYVPSTGDWWAIRSSDGTFLNRAWGFSSDIPIPNVFQR